MRDLWERLPTLIGRELRSDRPQGRPFTVTEVQTDAVVIRIQAGARRRGTAREYRINRDELMAIVNLGGASVGLPEIDSLALRKFTYAGYVLAMLRALDEGSA